MSIKQFTQRVVSKALRETGFISTFAYTNSYINDGEKDTVIHFNNFLGGLFPEIREYLDIRYKLFNKSGLKIIDHTITLAPDAGTTINVSSIVPPRKGSYGMIVAWVIPNFKTRRLLLKNKIHTLGSAFFVSWVAKNRSYACSHAIEAQKDRYYNLPLNLGSFLLSDEQKNPSGRYVCNRPFFPDKLNSLSIYFNNTREIPRITASTLFQEKSGKRHPIRFNLPPNGAKRIIFDKKMLNEFDQTEPILFQVDQLPSPNAKPYALLEFGKNNRLVAHHM